MRILSLSFLRPLRSVLAVTALVATAACADGSAAVSEDLDRDLAAARAASVELAPNRTRATEVVSAVERVPAGARAPVRRQPRARPARQPRTAPIPTANPAATPKPAPETPRSDVAAVPPSRDSSAADEGAPAPRPRPLPSTPERRGPYKSVGEVIRDAPFPINP
jgi:hypothetical protein